MKIREPAVAGTFYPGNSSGLNDFMDQILSSEKDKINSSLSKKKILGGIVPHAGYRYSGSEAMHFFEILHQDFRVFYDTVFILHPNHHGYGPEIAIDDNDFWKSPFGSVPIDAETRDALALPVSSDAHKYEHAGEVILPFLQKFMDYEFKILPISYLRQDPEISIVVAERIIEVNRILNKHILLIASTDFSHYISPDIGEKKDRKVLEKILNLNLKEMFNEIKQSNVSVCGYGPIMTLIHYVKKISNAPHAELLCFGNSAKNHKATEVVDYASVLFYED